LQLFGRRSAYAFLLFYLYNMNEETINAALSLRMLDLTSAANIQIIANAYRELFGKELCVTCGGDIRNAYYKIRSHFDNPNVMKLQGKPASKYKLKRGIILIHPSTKAMYSHMNITDEIAEEILSLNSNCESIFESLPKKKEQEVPADVKGLYSELTMKELKALAKSMELPKSDWKSLTKDELVQYISSK
jgi:hypothetical protein